MLVNGLLAGAEIAIVSVRTTRLAELVKSGSRAARAALLLREDQETFLATVQVGITVVGAAAGAFGGTAFAADLQPALEAVPGLSAYAREIAFALVVIIVSYLSVVLGELVPKSLALRSSEYYALLAARPLLHLSRVARPVVWLLAGSSNLILRVFGDRTTFTESRLSMEEIRHMVTEAAKDDEVDATTGEIVSRTLDLAGLTAEDVMVPMRHLESLPPEISIEEARRRLQASGRDRLPLRDEEGEGVLGHVTWRDLHGPSVDPTASVKSVVRHAFFVPEVMSALDVLREFQRRRTRQAGVVDEHGATVGVVFRHDLLEEIVGEMLGEHEEAPAARIRIEADGTSVMDGIVSIRAANRTLGLELDGKGRTRTVGGLCSLLAGGRIPGVGEELRAEDGTVLVPVEVSPRRVRVVAVRPPVPPSGPGPEAG